MRQGVGSLFMVSLSGLVIATPLLVPRDEFNVAKPFQSLNNEPQPSIEFQIRASDQSLYSSVRADLGKLIADVLDDDSVSHDSKEFEHLEREVVVPTLVETSYEFSTEHPPLAAHESTSERFIEQTQVVPQKEQDVPLDVVQPAGRPLTSQRLMAFTSTSTHPIEEEASTFFVHTVHTMTVNATPSSHPETTAEKLQPPPGVQKVPMPVSATNPHGQPQPKPQREQTPASEVIVENQFAPPQSPRLLQAHVHLSAAGAPSEYNQQGHNDGSRDASLQLFSLKPDSLIELLKEFRTAPPTPSTVLAPLLTTSVVPDHFGPQPDSVITAEPANADFNQNQDLTINRDVLVKDLSASDIHGSIRNILKEGEPAISMDPSITRNVLSKTTSGQSSSAIDPAQTGIDSSENGQNELITSSPVEPLKVEQHLRVLGLNEKSLDQILKYDNFLSVDRLKEHPEDVIADISAFVRAEDKHQFINNLRNRQSVKGVALDVATYQDEIDEPVDPSIADMISFDDLEQQVTAYLNEHPDGVYEDYLDSLAPEQMDEVANSDSETIEANGVLSQLKAEIKAKSSTRSNRKKAEANKTRKEDLHMQSKSNLGPRPKVATKVVDVQVPKVKSHDDEFPRLSDHPLSDLPNNKKKSHSKNRIPMEGDVECGIEDDEEEEFYDLESELSDRAKAPTKDEGEVSSLNRNHYRSSSLDDFKHQANSEEEMEDNKLIPLNYAGGTVHSSTTVQGSEILENTLRNATSRYTTSGRQPLHVPVFTQDQTFKSSPSKGDSSRHESSEEKATNSNNHDRFMSTLAEGHDGSLSGSLKESSALSNDSLDKAKKNPSSLFEKKGGSVYKGESSSLFANGAPEGLSSLAKVAAVLSVSMMVTVGAFVV